MDDRQKIATEIFNSGFNCAQAVLTSYQENFDFDDKFALSISSGFGGGMGRLQKTCGAVTGAFMVIGLYNVRKYKTIAERKAETYKMVQEFHRKFLELNNTSDCSELLTCDLNTEEGKSYQIENGLVEKVCQKCITDSVKILDELTGLTIEY
jgi:C_GCAxxG_C_C family probable redox protein